MSSIISNDTSLTTSTISTSPTLEASSIDVAIPDTQSQPLTKWNILATTNNPTPRQDNSINYFEGHLYTYGGSDGTTSTASFASFLRMDILTNTWQTLICPLRTRVLHSTVVHNRSMYIYGGGVYEDERVSFFGGVTKVFKTLNELVKYDFDTKDWTVLPNNLGSNRDGHSAILIGDDMYIIGGSHSITQPGKNMQSILFNEVQIYNIVTDEWSTIPCPTFGRLGTAVHYRRNYNDYIYFFGGYDAQSRPSGDLWKLDVKTSKWTLIAQSPNSPTARYGHSANVFEDKMYIYGGYNKKGYLRDFHYFDLVNEQWKPIPTLDSPPKRRRQQTVTIDVDGRPRLLLFGGAYISCIYNDLWEYIFPSKVHIPSDKLIGDFITLFENAEEYFSDICFIVEGQKIHAHRNILCVRSSYFKSLLTSGLKESFEKEIIIKDEKYEEFLTMIRFIYSGDETLATLDNCMGLLHLADCYLIPRLKITCEAKAIEGIEVDTVVSIFRQADFYKLDKLRQICLTFIAKNHKECLSTGALTGLDSSVLLEIMYYLDPSLIKKD